VPDQRSAEAETVETFRGKDLILKLPIHVRRVWLSLWLFHIAVYQVTNRPIEFNTFSSIAMLAGEISFGCVKMAKSRCLPRSSDNRHHGTLSPAI